MAIVAVTGDSCTTTTVALAAAWPITDDVVVIEADPSGGDLAAWFDMPITPSLSTVVTRVLDGSWPEIDALTRLSASGVRLVPAPAHAAEVRQAVSESGRTLVTALAALRSPVSIVDVGSTPATSTANPFLAAATVTVVVHRQSLQSSRAAAVRLQRLADRLDGLTDVSTSLVVAIVGARPFDLGEIETFLSDAIGTTPVVALPVDQLAAAVLGGRTGVSSRRLGRLPLMRAAGGLASVVEGAVHAHADGLWRSAR